MRKKRNGFTLAEMLVVVVIAASVVILAVPSFKKTQNRARFDAARGLLMDLGSAVQAVREDLRMANSLLSFPENQVTLSTNTVPSQSEMDEYGLNDLVNFAGNDTAMTKAMFGLDYLPLVSFDENTTDKYKGYTFYICKEGGGEGCCSTVNGIAPVVCMSDNNADAKYKIARYLEDTTIVLK